MGARSEELLYCPLTQGYCTAACPNHEAVRAIDDRWAKVLAQAAMKAVEQNLPDEEAVRKFIMDQSGIPEVWRECLVQIALLNQDACTPMSTSLPASPTPSAY